MRSMKAEKFIENAKVGDFDQAEYVSLSDAEKALNIAHEDAVKKWSLWCFNYRKPFEQVICKIWGGTLSGIYGRYYCEDNLHTQHLIEKWQHFENQREVRMLFFYCDLDTEHQNKLVEWVMENYAG